MSEWIEVSQSLPPDEHCVMVCGSKRLAVAVARYTKLNGWEVEVCSDWISIYEPKYWQSLPELPPDVVCGGWYHDWHTPVSNSPPPTPVEPR